MTNSENEIPHSTDTLEARYVPGDGASWHGKKADVYDDKRFTTAEGVFIQRFEEELFLDFLSRYEVRRVLDVPAGTGRMSIPIAEHVQEVVGADISADMLEKAKQKADAKGLVNLEFEVANVTELPFPDASFDAVCTLRLFQHVPTEMASPIVDELMRVIKPGGVLIVQFRSGFYGLFIHIFRYARLKNRGLRNRCLFPDQIRSFFGGRKIVQRAGYKFPASGKFSKIFGYRFIHFLNRLLAKTPCLRWTGAYMTLVVRREFD